MTENERAASTSRTAAEMLLTPVDTVRTTVSHVPGVGRVKEAFDGVLDTVGMVSPRSRRIAAYAGVGLLGAAGVVEWPVAAAGAAVVWLTQSRPRTGGPDAPQGGTATGGASPAKEEPSARRRAAARRAKRARRRTTAESQAATAGR